MDKKKPLRDALYCSLLLPSLALSQAGQLEESSIDCDLTSNQNRPECAGTFTERTVDEVVVTGTYLHRDKFTSPSPIEVITIDDLEEAGNTSFGDYIRDLPFTLNSNTINNIIDRGGTGGDRQDGADTSFNLRGFGTDGTVTLINGVRAPTALDASGLVPTIAMQRVEVLMDGGGALYGADAIAGVVNLITLKEFDGFRARLYHGSDSGRDYSDSKLELLTGGRIGNVDVVVAFEAQKRTTLSNTERPQYMKESIGISNSGSPTYYLNAATALTPNPTELLDPGCGAHIEGGNFDNPARTGYLPTGIRLENNSGDYTRCGFAYDEYQDYLPSLERYVSYTSFKYDVNENFSVDYNLALHWRETTTRTSPHLGGVPGEAGGGMASMLIRNDHPGMPAEIQSGTSMFAPYVLAPSARPFGKLGTLPSSYNGDGSRNEDRETYTYAHTINANYNFGDTGWSGVTYASSSKRRDIHEADFIYASRLAAALQGLGGPNCDFDSSSLIGLSTLERQAILNAAPQTRGQDGCEYFNPFSTAWSDPGLANSQELVDWLVERSSWNGGSTKQRVWETRVHGDLFDLPAGPVALAVGYNYRKIVYETGPNRLTAMGDNLNLATDDFLFSETVRSQFAEVGVPILHNLHLSAAVRREKYTDRSFGSVTKPKFSLSYQPTDDLVLRASYGESFTAPRADELDTGSIFQTALTALTQDPFSNGTNGVPAASGHGGTLVVAGNPELRPEESELINLGFTYRGIENWQFSVDMQEIKFFDRVVRLSRQELLQREYNQFIESGGDINNQTDVLNFFAANPNAEIIRSPVDGGIITLYQRPTNTEDITARFVDIKIENHLSTDRWGYFHTILSATTYERYRYQDEVTFEKRDAVGKRNRDVSAASAIPRWKANLTMRWMKDQHSVVARANYIHSVKFDGEEINLGATPPDRISSYTTVDLRYTYRMPDVYNGRMEFTLGSTNIFNREADKLPVAGGFESRLHDPFGRRIYFEVGYDF